MSPFPRVSLRDGLIEGFEIVSSPVAVNAFLGIPFAQPPIGELRFEKPLPALPWQGVKETKAFCSKCNQIPDPESGENCLYLNVFAPAEKPDATPVLVLIHGGAFAMGSAQLQGDVGIAKNLVSRGVIAVSITYRVGGLGWFSSGDSTMPGNYGMWDATLALQWVHDNIDSFGGDPNNVTLYGGSAAAALVDGLAMSPHSYSFFHAVITSGIGDRDVWRNDYAAECRELARDNGLLWKDSQELKALMKTTDLEWLKGKYFAVAEDSFDFMKLDWGMRYDGDFFPEPPEVLRSKAPAKPRIFGTAQLEGAAFTWPLKITNESVEKVVECMVPKGHEDRDVLVANLTETYRSLARAAEPEAVAKHAMQILRWSHILIKSDCLQALGERGLVACLKHSVDQNTKIHGDTQNSWLFVFEHFNPASYGQMYPYVSFASHVSDEWYITGNEKWEYTEEDHRMASFMADVVTNFCKTSDPNGPSKLPIDFHSITPDHPDRHLVADLVPVMSEDFFGGRIKLNNDLLKSFLALSE